MNQVVQPLVKIEDLSVHFDMKQGFLSGLISSKKKVVRAVDGISLEINKGEILSLVGESGSGENDRRKSDFAVDSFNRRKN